MWIQVTSEFNQKQNMFFGKIQTEKNNRLG